MGHLITSCIFTVLLATLVLPQECRVSTLSGYVKGGESFSRTITDELEFRLSPLRNNWGWTVSVSPAGSDADWTYPVNLPLSTGESQLLGTGYGTTARERLKFPRRVRFVLNRSVYSRYVALANDALVSTREEAVGDFIAEMHRAETGLLVITPTEYDNDGDPQAVKWMRFNLSVTVPKSTKVALHLRWRATKCPERN